MPCLSGWRGTGHWAGPKVIKVAAKLHAEKGGENWEIMKVVNNFVDFKKDREE